MTTIRIALPDSLHATVRDIVEREGMSVAWSVEDQCYVGSCPGLFYGGCHGDDERAVFSELCRIVEETIELYEREGMPLPLPQGDKSTQKRDVKKAEELASHV